MICVLCVSFFDIFMQRFVVAVVFVEFFCLCNMQTRRVIYPCTALILYVCCLIYNQVLLVLVLVYLFERDSHV